MKDDFLSAEWAKHHSAFTSGFYVLLVRLSFGLLTDKPVVPTSADTVDQRDAP